MSAAAIATCILYDGTAEEAARFYVATFPDSHIDAIHHAPSDYPAGAAGSLLTVEFTICEMRFVGLNGGPMAAPTQKISFQVFTDDQAETDRLWDAIVGNGGVENACSWCSDRWGVSWQIVPRALMAALSHPDPAARARAFAAMMTMRKIDIAAIARAVAGETA